MMPTGTGPSAARHLLMTDTTVPAPARALIARIGLAARGFVYFAVAIMLADAALTAKPDNGASPGDAFRALETQQGGRILLICLAGGLFLYALWRFQQAILDPEEHGNSAKGIFARIGMAMSGMSYLLVGVAAAAVTFGQNDSGGSDGGKTEQTARWLMEQPFGRWVVALAGLALVGIGCAQIWRANSGQWKNHLDLSGWAARLTRPISLAIAGRGVLFMLVGGFLLIGGMEADRSDIKGLAATLGLLREQPFGLELFVAAALAIGFYGVYSSVQAVRYKFPDS